MFRLGELVRRLHGVLTVDYGGRRFKDSPSAVSHGDNGADYWVTSQILDLCGPFPAVRSTITDITLHASSKAVSRMAFTAANNKTIAEGGVQPDVQGPTYLKPLGVGADWRLIGFHGAAGSLLDRLGAYFVKFKLAEWYIKPPSV
ncbi:hypothetical protein T492DRAFT_846860 [Pavlovales sp. CCMP2436]|nr:hypothetical protein T492DRAFT_846860 [Pavlovales sp. CCMP2436]